MQKYESFFFLEICWAFAKVLVLKKKKGLRKISDLKLFFSHQVFFHLQVFQRIFTLFPEMIIQLKKPFSCSFSQNQNKG